MRSSFMVVLALTVAGPVGAQERNNASGEATVTPLTTLPSLDNSSRVTTPAPLHPADVQSPIRSHMDLVHASTVNGGSAVQMQPLGSTPCQSGAHLNYYGGNLIQHPQVFAYYWGSGVGFGPGNSPGTMNQFLSSILHSQYIDWLKEYDTGSFAIRRGGLLGSFTDSGVQTTGTISMSVIHDRLLAQISAGVIPNYDADVIYAVYIPASLTGVWI